MALAHNPTIVRTGMILHLDAANPKSYPSTGTVWTDLTGNGNNSNLVNGVGYSTDNIGSLTFDGVNDAVESTGSSLSISNAITIAAWINNSVITNKINRYITVGSEVAVLRHDGENSTGQLHFYIKTSGVIRSIRVNSSLVRNTWYYIAGVWDGTTARLYRNAVSIGSTVPGGTLDGGSLNYFVSTSAEPMNGRISNVQIYNRALFAPEVRRNFEAFRDRYGI